MVEAYPVFIKKYADEYLVYVPDFCLYTEGTSLTDAIAMSRDAIGLKGMDMEDEHLPLPAPSTSAEAMQKAKAEADADFDYSDGLLTLVDVDFTAYRNKLNNRSVKKNCTLPYWLNAKAEELGINFSQTLQEALLTKIGS